MNKKEIIEQYSKIIEKIGDKKSVRNKIYSKIFHTDFYWDVPYLIDVEKFKKDFSNSRMDVKRLKSVRFSFEIYKNSFGGPNFVLYMFTNCPEDNSKDFLENFNYECFQFLDYQKYSIKDFIEFVEKTTKCIIGIDEIEVEKIKEKRIKEIEKLKNQNLFLENLI